MKRRRTPQEKKALSYAKDCRNVYGANNKASRKNIPLTKAKERRRFRKQAQQSLHRLYRSGDEGAVIEESSLIRNVWRAGGWTKLDDEPLRAFVERQKQNRLGRYGRKKSK